MATLLQFASSILRVCPPWLRRPVGAALMQAFGDQMDVEIDRTVKGMDLRFPNGNQEEALSKLASDRKIQRGPAELGPDFAVRLRLWWDSHKTRGGPYALLGQAYWYFLFVGSQITLLANGGLRHTLATDGTITRDSIAWNGDGTYPTNWARIWLIFDLPSDAIDLPLLTESGEVVTTESGETVLVSVPVVDLTAADKEIFCVVPREWSAAHIDFTQVILLPPGGELWGYPEGTWADTDPSPGQVWGSTDPVYITC